MTIVISLISIMINVYIMFNILNQKHYTPNDRLTELTEEEKIFDNRILIDSSGQVAFDWYNVETPIREDNWTITDETTEYDLYMMRKSFEREQEINDDLTRKQE